MSTPVQAQSLSSLTNLFANPPHYPRNPTHDVHEPLVLYIVRVPGSKDIFLSPVKPPTKESVSLDAIQSSLYYLHVNTAEDEEVKQSIDERRKSEESSRPSITVARKPLPSSPFANHPLPPLPGEAPQPQACQQTRADRVLQPYEHGYAHDTTALKVDTNTSLHRKPVDARSTLGTPTIYKPSGDYALSPSIHKDQLSFSSRDTQQQDAYRTSNSPSPSYTRDASGRAQGQQFHNASSPYPPSGLEAARSADPTFLSVTIVRRDPASGSQWNIGTITLLEPTFPGSKVKPVHIELTTPGYGRFNRGAGFETPQSASAGSDIASIRRAIETATISPASATSPNTPVGPFSRTVDFRKMAASDLRRTVYQRTNSSDSIGKTSPVKPGSEKNVLAFTSPWHGTCTFVNAIDGKTIRIKHTISSNSSSAEGVTANVAELRFNLGWSILSNVRESHGRRTESEPDKLPIPKLLESKKENFRRSFQNLKNRGRETLQKSRSSNSNEDVLRDLSNVQTPTTNNLNDRAYPKIHNAGSNYQYGQTADYRHAVSSTQPSSEDNDDEQNRISLRLGRERAGGGYRGNSAKLGKLVIEDEGLKMCDLVVGAAMGIWWQHYGT